MTLYDGFHAGATGASDQRFLNAMPDLRPMTEVDRSAALSAAARRWAVDHPGELPALSVRKAARGWSPVPLSAEFGRPAYRWVSAAYAVPFDLLCVVGLCSRRLTRSSKVLLLMPAVAVTVAQVMSVGSIRYRLPAEATLAVLAAVGSVHLRSQISDFESRSGWGWMPRTTVTTAHCPFDRLWQPGAPFRPRRSRPRRRCMAALLLFPAA